MFKSQIKFQKILFILLLIAFALMFIFSLSILTHIYETLFRAYDPDLGEYGEYVAGADLFYEMQPFNNQLVMCSLVVLFAALTYPITGSTKRRKYYVGNYVSAGIIGAANIAVAVFTIVGVAKYKAEYLKIDFEALAEWNKQFGSPADCSTFWFDVGYYVAAILIFMAVLVVANVLWKRFLMKKEDQLLNPTEVV